MAEACLNVVWRSCDDSPALWRLTNFRVIIISIIIISIIIIIIIREKSSETLRLYKRDQQ